MNQSIDHSGVGLGLMPMILSERIRLRKTFLVSYGCKVENGFDSRRLHTSLRILGKKRSLTLRLGTPEFNSLT
jgi:hypothetical protein